MKNIKDIQNKNELLDGSYLDAKILFMHLFNALPQYNYICCIDAEKLYLQFIIKCKDMIVDTYKYSWYKHSKKQFQFDTVILVLNNKCIIAFDDDSASIFHLGTYQVQAFIQEFTDMCSKHKERNKKEPQEINLIVASKGGLTLKSIEIKPTKLQIPLFYEDDFAAVDKTIRERLNKKEDKGVVLLHGLPGTGKTTYLRYLIGKMKKRVLFVSPSIASNLMNPDLIQLLIDNPNTILVIEDAENIIMDRKYSSDGGVSSLLNISDGLLADFLNVQIICTFNSNISMIDQALMRKGRLIARYEFGKLSVEKANALSAHLNTNTIFTEPKTLAEITNPDSVNYAVAPASVIGFRKFDEVYN
jgi:ATPase family associated with various cellular activities (AAA)